MWSRAAEPPAPMSSVSPPAHHQAARDRPRAVRGLVRDRREQQLGGHPADLLQAHVHAGQRGLGAERHGLPVVEADQRHLIRDGPAGRAERVGHPPGDLVAAAEDRVGVRRRAEQRLGGPAPPLLAPLTEPHAAVRRQARRRERAAEPRRALACRHEPLRPGDVPDPSPPAGQQVLGGGSPAALVVGQHRGPVVVERPGHRVDDRDAGPGGHRRPRLGPAAGDDQAVHPAGGQHLDVALLPVRVVPRVAHEHRDLAGAEGVLRTEHDRDAEPAETVRGDQAHREGTAREQGLGQRVRREAEPLRRLGDALPGFGAQLALPVEGLGSGADGHAGLRRHVTDGHPPHLHSSGSFWVPRGSSGPASAVDASRAGLYPTFP